MALLDSSIEKIIRIKFQDMYIMCANSKIISDDEADVILGYMSSITSTVYREYENE